MKKMSAVILAAGKGKRMNSHKPKVLQPLAGRAMIEHLLETVLSLSPQKIHLVCGYQSELVQQHLKDYPLNFVYQEEQKGTGHAMACAAPFFADDEFIIMLYGDAPLIGARTLELLLESVDANSLGILTAFIDNPHGYGRVVRDERDEIIAIVEHQDATAQQRSIREINTGVMVASGQIFNQYLQQLTNDNAQGEYYMTDIIALAQRDGVSIRSVILDDIRQAQGANDPLQLHNLERYFQEQTAQKLASAGLFIKDCQRFDLCGDLQFGKDCIIEPNVYFQGRVVLGNNVRIGTGAVIIDSTIGDDSIIEPYSVIEKSRIDTGVSVGPFARLRPHTRLSDRAKIGNFVEVKQAQIGKGTKVNHLSYVGDSEIGERCNIGAGVITCNYDGANKHKTLIGDEVFVGSDCQLIAPISIASGATIGAGTTLTENVHNAELVLSRLRQFSVANYRRPQKDTDHHKK